MISHKIAKLFKKKLLPLRIFAWIIDNLLLIATTHTIGYLLSALLGKIINDLILLGITILITSLIYVFSINKKNIFIGYSICNLMYDKKINLYSAVYLFFKTQWLFLGVVLGYMVLFAIYSEASLKVQNILFVVSISVIIAQQIYFAYSVMRYLMYKEYSNTEGIGVKVIVK